MTAVLVTLEVSHDLMSGLVKLPENKAFISVTNDVQHSEA